MSGRPIMSRLSNRRGGLVQLATALLLVMPALRAGSGPPPQQEMVTLL